VTATSLLVLVGLFCSFALSELVLYNNTIGQVVAKTTSATGPTKTRATMVAKGKCAIRATVKKTAVRIQRSVKASSNGVRGMACKVARPPANESTSKEEVGEEGEDNEQADPTEGQEGVCGVEKTEAIEKGREQSDMQGLESISVASAPYQAVLCNFAGQRIHNRGGKPRVIKTYNVGKTIHAKYYKGKLGPRRWAI